MKLIPLRNKEYELMQFIIEQVSASPESLGISSEDAEDIYEAVFRQVISTGKG